MTAPAVNVAAWAHPRVRLGLALVFTVLVAGVAAPWLSPYDPIAQLDVIAAKNLPPSPAHPFGTDVLSRDLLSRVAHGVRVSMSVALFSVALSLTVGVGVGLIAGYAGGALDALLMRLVDMLMAIPRILVPIVVLALWTRVGVGTLILILGLTSWFEVSRRVRAEVLSLRERDYLRAARALGVPTAAVLLRHILPNVAAPIAVAGALGVGNMILLEAGLSFLGMGVPPPTPSLGNIISEGRDLLPVAPWISLIPGAVVVLIVVAFMTLGDGLRDALDPRAQ